jgi:predicted transcriptional regulator
MQSMAQEVLDTMYQGSVTKFFAALCGDTPLSAKDRKELKAWLDKEM